MYNRVFMIFVICQPALKSTISSQILRVCVTTYDFRQGVPFLSIETNTYGAPLKR